MDYHALNTMRQQKPEYCVLRDYPEGMGMKTYKLSKGVELEPGEYPKDARITMSKEEKGMELPDLVGNTCNMLILSARVAEAVEKVNKAKAQYLPVSIYNHKKRLASKDYVIVNPIGLTDALDLEASEIEWHEDEVVGIDKYVLDPKKLKKVPDLFRLKEEPQTYIISQRIIDAWRAIAPKPTNISFVTLEQSGGGKSRS